METSYLNTTRQRQRKISFDNRLDGSARDGAGRPAATSPDESKHIA